MVYRGVVFTLSFLKENPSPVQPKKNRNSKI